ncbi:hypothetical protein CONCODRAFT_9208, partial [Conidiobolus coronatus NRRL 28638]
SLAITKFKAYNYGHVASVFSVPHLYGVSFDPLIPSIAGLPHLIPSLIASGIIFAAFILSYRYLDETLTYKKSNLDEYTNAEKSTSQAITLEKSNQVGKFELKLPKNSLLLLTGSSLLTLIYGGYSRITQDWPTLELSKGGLNLKSYHTLVTTLLFFITELAILKKYPYIYKKIGALKLFKTGFSAAGALFIFSLILTLLAKTGSTFIVLSLYAILFSIERGINTLTEISFDLLLTESAEASGNLGTLYGISSTLSGAISLILPYIFVIFSDLSIENSLPFPFNYSITWFLAILSLTGYWLSSKIKSTENQN